MCRVLIIFVETPRRGVSTPIGYHHAVAGLLTAPPVTPETYGRRFRRGRETHAEQEAFFSSKLFVDIAKLIGKE
jgi:hypothetical protein